MLVETQMTVPIEVITTTVQRSVRYVATDDVNLALAAMRHDAEDRPERYDDIDTVVSHHIDVQLPEHGPMLVHRDALPSHAEVEDVCDLIAPYDDPTEIMPVGWRPSA